MLPGLLLLLLAGCAAEAPPPAALAAAGSRPAQAASMPAPAPIPAPAPMPAVATPAATAPAEPPPSGGAEVAALPPAGADAPPLPKAKPAVSETFTGTASWYGRNFHGRLTASGEHYDMAALTAAHQTLPFGSRVRVTNLDNGRSVVVVINDRGPYAEDRLIDLSRAAAKRLGIVEDGVAEVRVEVLADAAG